MANVLIRLRRWQPLCITLVAIFAGILIIEKKSCGYNCGAHIITANTFGKTCCWAPQNANNRVASHTKMNLFTQPNQHYVFLLNAGWNACCVSSKHPYPYVVTRGLEFVWLFGTSAPIYSWYTYAAALSAGRLCLQSDWLINEQLSHQRQQPVGSSIPYLETLIRNCSEWSVESRKLKWKTEWRESSSGEVRRTF